MGWGECRHSSCFPATIGLTCIRSYRSGQRHPVALDLQSKYAQTPNNGRPDHFRSNLHDRQVKPFFKESLLWCAPSP